MQPDNSQKRETDWVWFIEQLDKLAIDLTKSLSGLGRSENHKQEAFCFSLFMRAHSNSKAAVILARKGFLIEARTLARSCVESAIYLSALRNDARVIDELEKDELKSQKGTINAAISLIKAMEIQTDFSEKLAERSAELDKLERKSIIVADL